MPDANCTERRIAIPADAPAIAARVGVGVSWRAMLSATKSAALAYHAAADARRAARRHRAAGRADLARDAEMLARAAMSLACHRGSPGQA